MTRSDYRINEDGVERRATIQKVMAVLSAICPYTCQDIEWRMRVDGIPYEYELNGKRVRIEYKGPQAEGGL